MENSELLICKTRSLSTKVIQVLHSDLITMKKQTLANVSSNDKNVMKVDRKNSFLFIVKCDYFSGFIQFLEDQTKIL